MAAKIDDVFNLLLGHFMHKFKIIIIGGGPAGMMAGIQAALTLGSGKDVAIFEANDALGKKLLLTGKGRCNITNACSLDVFLEKFNKNGQFLRGVFRSFFVSELIDFFQKHGLKMKHERQGRVFPETDSAKSVVDVLRKVLADKGVHLYFDSPVSRITIEEGRVKGVVLKDGLSVFSDSVIVAAGGASFPETGSDGNGARMAHDTGHKVEPLIPGLVPFQTVETFVKEVQGLVLKNVKVTFCVGSKKLETPIGEVLFTHFGISGPLVLDASVPLCRMASQGGIFKAAIDLKPALSAEQIDKKLQAEFQKHGAVQIKNYLKELLPKKMIDLFLKQLNIKGETVLSRVSAPERRRIVGELKALTLTIRKPLPLSCAMVTQGGVSLKEINPNTMESRKIKGLYFCGEVLDLAASSGGFNLQAAFSTGYVAGESAAKNM